MKAYTIQIRLSDLDMDLLTNHLRVAKDRYEAVVMGRTQPQEASSLLLRSAIRCIEAIEEASDTVEEDGEYFS